MSGTVTLEVTRGERANQKFTYTEKARVFIGRQEDCGIVLPESTVSRYHCVLEILPPEVKLQDFGSLNGTYLNGEMIGKRDRNQSWEQAKAAPSAARICRRDIAQPIPSWKALSRNTTMRKVGESAKVATRN